MILNTVKKISSCMTQDKAKTIATIGNDMMDNQVDAKVSSGSAIEVQIATIAKALEYQVRAKTDQATVSRYAEVIKAGVDMPPVKLARVKVSEKATPLLVIVDGWHRVGAHEKLGRVTIQATIEDMDPAAAKWEAGKANMGHGLPLSRQERKEVFRRFVKAKQNVLGKHRNGRTKYLSYREMETKLGINYGTLRHWMKTEFPKIYAEMGDKVPNGDWTKKAKEASEVSISSDKACPVAKLKEALEIYQATTDARLRGEAVILARQIVEQMEKAGGWEYEAPDF